ncbi:MAG: ABC transporter permease [Alphaproteobacteria bacterium]
MAYERVEPRRMVLWAFCVLILVFLVAPIVVIVITSFNDTPYLEFPPKRLSLRWYGNFFRSPQWFEPALLSLRVALVTMATATVIGTLAALGIARGRFRGRRGLELFFVSPMVVPVVVLALGLYFLFAGYHLLATPAALFLGHTVSATPIVIVIVLAALRTTDSSIELAARSLGANYWRSLWHVTVPVIRPSILSSAAFAFLISFDEVVIAIFVGGPDATTLPKRMWETIRFEIDPTLTAISTLLTLVAALVLIAAELSRRAHGAGRGRSQFAGDA